MTASLAHSFGSRSGHSSDPDGESRWILVVGGGMAGVMAALAAKTDANQVLIVEPSNVLGGQGTAGGVAGFCGDTELVNDPFRELVGRLGRHGLIRACNPLEDRRSYDLEWCAFFLQEMVLEREIDVLLHSRVIGVEASEGRITSVTISTSGGIEALHPRFVVDASGSCVVPVLAGFPVVREGANKQLPMSLYFTLWDTGKPVRPFLPPGCEEWRGDDEIPMTSLHCFDSGKVEVKMKVVGFDAADGLSMSRAELVARRQMTSLIYYLQTTGYRGTRLDRHVLASVSRQIGVRESCRIVGEHVLSVDEVTHGAVFDDAVAVGTYHLDYHWPDRMQRGDTGITTMVEPYHIPLRAMIPRGAKNMLVPGRSASGDQLAMSSFRVMATVAQMGFAAGTAAQTCVSRRVALESIDIAELQAALEAGGQRLDLSCYGGYLRNGLLQREAVFSDAGRFASCRSPAILQLRHGRFLVAWVATRQGPATGPELWVADRYQGRWSSPRCVGALNAHVSGHLALQAGEEGLRVVCMAHGMGESGKSRAVFSADEGQTWKEAARYADSPTVSDHTVFRVPDQGIVRVVTGDSDVSPKAGLWLSVSVDGGGAWTEPIDIDGSGAPCAEPAFVATARGLAVSYVRNEHELVFWHGSIEHLLDPEAVAHHTEALHSGVMP